MLVVEHDRTLYIFLWDVVVLCSYIIFLSMTFDVHFPSNVRIMMISHIKQVDLV